MAMFYPIRVLRARPRMVAALVFGLLVAGGLHFARGGLSISTRSILSWDAGCLWFIASMLHLMRKQTVETMQRRAAQQDEGQGFILALVLIASIASIGAVAMELSIAKSLHGFLKTVRVLLAFGTVAISWFLVHLIFAVHYAHEYFSSPNAPDEGIDATQRFARTGRWRAGLAFPGKGQPDFWDFLHFAIVIGVGSQTADIAFTSKTLRRIGTIHGLVAFTFNTVVLALGINLVAGLF